MKKTKALTLLIAMALITSVTINASATTNGTVMIGAKSFDLTYANDPANIEEINNAIVENGTVFIKGFDGVWIDNTTGKIVDVSVISAVTTGNEKVTVEKSNVVEKEAEVNNENVELYAERDKKANIDAEKQGVVSGKEGVIPGQPKNEQSIFDAAHDWGLNSPRGGVGDIDPSRYTDTTTPHSQYCTFGPRLPESFIKAINEGQKVIYVTSDKEGKNRIDVNIKAVNGKTLSIFNDTDDITTIIINGDHKVDLIKRHVYSIFMKLPDGTTLQRYFQALG